APNCGVRWWITGRAIAARTSGGTGVGSGARRNDLITALPVPLYHELAKRALRFAAAGAQAFGPLIVSHSPVVNSTRTPGVRGSPLAARLHRCQGSRIR